MQAQILGLTLFGEVGKDYFSAGSQVNQAQPIDCGGLFMDATRMDLESGGSLKEPLLGTQIRLNAEVLFFIFILVLAFFSRFYDLESRVMSHDENTHVYFSWLLEQGQGYSHDPLSHGPFQFHAVALSYFLFGDTDATSRFPSALFGVAAVLMVFLFRKWLGKTGTAVAAVLMLVSPYMLFYSRYVRNEMLVVPQTLLLFWAMFRYMETRRTKWLYLLVLALSLHYTTKETSYMYTAALLVFLGLYFGWQLLRIQWQAPLRKQVLFGSLVVLLAGGGLAGSTFLKAIEEDFSSAGVVGGVSPLIYIGAGLAVLGLVGFFGSLIREFGHRLRTSFPSFDLIVVILTMVLPQLAAVVATVGGWDPLAYEIPEAFQKTTITIIVLAVLAAGIGMLWDWRRWLTAAGFFYVPFIILYTTFFTNGLGLASGLVGSLGYWIVQQGVERGSQPLFYYAFLQIPIYEYVAALGVLLAAGFGLSSWNRTRKSRDFQDPVSVPSIPESDVPLEESLNQMVNDAPGEKPFEAVFFLGYWAVSMLALFTYAGERMPWLTVHILLPMILLSGWSAGKFLDRVDWKQWKSGWLVVAIEFVLLVSVFSLLGVILGPEPPFQGQTLEQLNATSNFFSALIVTAAAAAGLWYLGRPWPLGELWKSFGVLFGLLLMLQTARTAFRAAYINYDYPTEYLVYAHSGTGPKIALEQIQELSMKTTGGLDIQIAYDNETLYPYWWYLRNYSNAYYFASNPSRTLLNYPIVTAGAANWAKIDPLLEDHYYSMEMKRIWWPNQDYFAMGYDRINSEYIQEQNSAGIFETDQLGAGGYIWKVTTKLVGFLLDREWRNALWQVWFNRDYDAYAALKGREITLQDWDPSDNMKLYVRKDIAGMIWDYGATPTIYEPEEFVDPYESRMTVLAASHIIDGSGTEPGQLLQPRGLAVAPDGSLYVADAGNHRIQQFSPEGEFLRTWGSFSGGDGQAEPGTFNDPWGVTTALDGKVLVADTWNHRIQIFTAEGVYLDSFGIFGQAETVFGFWGPRDVVVDSSGRIYLTDTGNKRVVVADADGQYVTDFGGFGLDPGYLDEPVGIGMDGLGFVYVADTWNQRIQVFDPADDLFAPVRQWDIEGWYGQSLENKPYLDVNEEGIVCTTDPEGYRVLCFNSEGEFLQGFGGFGSLDTQFTLPSGIAMDDQCGVWVSDTPNNRVLYFELNICSAEE
ncbi:MAG: TIGR03663 family protein [Anaerolineales bacterium]|nr:TIGR03663 family protein [Anaerolineales bacterium]